MSNVATEKLPLHAAYESPAINPWFIALTVSLATFMEVLDTSIANVALPHMAGSLAAGSDESTWVLTSYLVANAIILPISGWLSDTIGRKRFYMTCVAVFTVSSMLCGLAPSLGWLVVFRILQGLGGGGLQPVAQAILADTFAPNKRGQAFAIYGMAVVAAPALGPTLGGWITDNYNWRWIFYINVPVGIFSLIMVSRLVREKAKTKPSSDEPKRVDFVGLGLVAVGLGTMQVVLDKGQQEDWFGSSFIVGMTIVCVVCLLTAVVWELRHASPVVDLRLLKDRNFALANVLMFVLGFVLLGSTVLLPQMLQSLMGYTAMQAGMVLSPGGIVILFMLPIVGKLLGKGVQPKWMVAFGLLVGALGLWRMGQFNQTIDFHTAMVARVVQASGIAFMFIPTNTMAFAFVPGNKNNAASGIVNLSRNIGGGVGIAFVTTMLARQSQIHQNSLVGHVTPYDESYRARLAELTEALTHQGMSAAEAGQRAMGMIYHTVQQQAAMLGYVDVFRMMMIVMLVSVPLALVMKKISGNVKVSAGH